LLRLSCVLSALVRLFASSRYNIYCDNESAIKLAKNLAFHWRTKHFDVNVHFVRELQDKEQVSITHVKSEHQLADIFTKPLPGPRFVTLRERIGMGTFSDQPISHVWGCCRVHDRQDGFLWAGSGNAARRVGETEKKEGGTETEKGTSRSTRLREYTHARTPLFCDFSFCSVFLCVNLFVGQPATNFNFYFAHCTVFCFYRPATGEILVFSCGQQPTCHVWNTVLYFSSRVFSLSSPVHVVLATEGECWRYWRYMPLATIV
jgi:hypothetical protein